MIDGECHAHHRRDGELAVFDHGALFSGVLVAMFAPPVLALRSGEAIAALAGSGKGLASGLAAGLEQVRTIGVALAPLATALAAMAIPDGPLSP